MYLYIIKYRLNEKELEHFVRADRLLEAINIHYNLKTTDAKIIDYSTWKKIDG